VTEISNFAAVVQHVGGSSSNLPTRRLGVSICISVVHSLHIKRSSHLILRLTQPPVRWVSGPFSAEVVWPGHEADYSPPSSFRVRGSSAVPLIYHMYLWCEYDKFMHDFRLLLQSRWEHLLYVFISHQTVLCWKIFFCTLLALINFFLIFCQIDGPWNNFKLYHLCFDSFMWVSQILGARLCGWLNFIWWCPVFSA